MKTIQLRSDLTNCTGCGACSVACPVQAIAMETDAQGFIRPVIDTGRCILCGKCAAVCPMEHPTESSAPKAAYAAVGKERGLVKNSASGGVFASMARKVVAQGGMAAGAVMTVADDGVDVFHLASDAEADIASMQGSKYTQSRAWESYDRVLLALREGKTVLFSGTPCQVAAIKSLSGNPEHLITVDLICHGVPSCAMLRDYLKLLGKRFRTKVKAVCFRDKSVSRDFTARIETDRKNFRLKSSLMSYYALFLKGEIYRSSCYGCPYACPDRVSDITIGDYWGIGEHHPELASGEKHWSCVLVNSAKGQQWLEHCKGELELFPSELTWISSRNHQLNHPSQLPDSRNSWLSSYEQEGYKGVERKFIRENGGYLKYFRNLYKSNRQFRKESE